MHLEIVALNLQMGLKELSVQVKRPSSQTKITHQRESRGSVVHVDEAKISMY